MGVYTLLPIFTNTFVLFYFDIEERLHALGVFERIKTIGERKKIRGMNRE
jgi:hypothetical protein